jgi:hypothetical protein
MGAVKTGGVEFSHFGTCELENWLEVLNTWVFAGRNGLIKG